MRVLLAEDDAMLGDGLRTGLRQLGFQVDWVRDGLAAERELRSGDYAAAVLDLGLPGKDGLDVLRAVRAADVSNPGAGADRARCRARPHPWAWTWVPMTTWSSRWTCMSWRRACARWCGAPTAQRKRCCGWAMLVLEPGTRRVLWQGQEVAVSTREFDLLACADAQWRAGALARATGAADVQLGPRGGEQRHRGAHPPPAAQAAGRCHPDRAGRGLPRQPASRGPDRACRAALCNCACWCCCRFP